MNTSGFATAAGVLAEALLGEGNYSEARKVAERAVALGKTTPDTPPLSFAALVTALAHTREIQGRRRQAMKLYQQAVDIMIAGGQSQCVELGTAYVNLAGAYLAAGNPNKVLELVSLALRIWQQILPSDNSFVLYATSLEVLAYEKLKAYREAEALVPELLREGGSQVASSQPDRIIYLSVAASLYVAEKKFETAASLLQQALVICKRTFPPGHPETRMVLANYSHVLAELGRTEEASRARAESAVLLVFPQRSQLAGVP
jgi:tetratricopeptide (TPR) repeat protein